MDEMNRLGMLFSRWRRRASYALAPYGITFAQFQLIRLVRFRGALAPSAAAFELGSDRPTITLVARTCLARGWLEKKSTPGDRRSFRLVLSGNGEELLDRIEVDSSLSPQLLGDPLDVLDSEERAAFLRIIDRVERRSRDIL